PRQAIGDAILHPRPDVSRSRCEGSLEESMAMLPAGEGTPELHVHEAEGRIELADHHPPLHGEAGHAHGEVEECARLEPRGRLGEPGGMRPARLHSGEVSRIGEELEDVGTRPRQPETPLDDVVGHDERAIIGGGSGPVKPAPPQRPRGSPPCGDRFRPSPSCPSWPFLLSSSWSSARASPPRSCASPCGGGVPRSSPPSGCATSAPSSSWASRASSSPRAERISPSPSPPPRAPYFSSQSRPSWSSWARASISASSSILASGWAWPARPSASCSSSPKGAGTPSPISICAPPTSSSCSAPCAGPPP